MPRPLYQIAREIMADWQPPHPTAAPYLVAMETLNSIDDDYFLDTGRSVVLYFLANASQWKGETARRIKKELNGLLK